MTAAPSFDVRGEVALLTAALKGRADPSYEWGMRRTVPSQQPAHAVRVPEVRRVAAAWAREHRSLPAGAFTALAQALWDTGWREERLLAVYLLSRRKAVMETLPWDTIEAWAAGIDNWEHVDNLAGLTGRMLVTRPELIDRVMALAASDHVWKRRLAIVTLIEAARDDPAWLPHLRAVAEGLRGDRGPTMRKALDWARRAAKKVEAKGA
ncbi:MAG TPA: DNA alkylation repair protein [Dehalococcoidia bacterium]|nr:DNA alkylation repair protein [Dehalococcoidia bacterium]